MNELFLIKGETLEATADTLRSFTNTLKLDFITDPAVNAGNGRFVSNSSVVVYYTEYFDVDGVGEYDSAIHVGNPKSTDVFVAYDFLTNNEGVLVPVIYKTDIDDQELATEPDLEDKFFYQGKAEIDGVDYDKWRKIEDDKYRWDSENKQYIYTNIIVVDNSISPADFPDKIGEVYNAGLAASSGDSEISLQSKTVRPNSNKQVVTADSGYDGLSSVTVNACSGEVSIDNTDTVFVAGYGTARISYTERSKIIPSNIKSGVSILGVEGTYSGGPDMTVLPNISTGWYSTTAIPSINHIEEVSGGFFDTIILIKDVGLYVSRKDDDVIMQITGPMIYDIDGYPSWGDYLTFTDGTMSTTLCNWILENCEWADE